MPQVTECHRVTGEDCFILKIHIAALDQLDQVLDRFLIYGQTTTSRCSRRRWHRACDRYRTKAA